MLDCLHDGNWDLPKGLLRLLRSLLNGLFRLDLFGVITREARDLPKSARAGQRGSLHLGTGAYLRPIATAWQRDPHGLTEFCKSDVREPVTPCHVRHGIRPDLLV